ncbi:MAG: GNAT family N-acetyltransferase [Beijerinckiaceae bacterium]|jgi:[ribosomal protein S18]-alanine N-acetyltransferase|nr:GNAT family N-acetyltransferase [Beijerinckiaceae bacterium]
MKLGFWRSPASVARPLTSGDSEACALIHGKSFKIGWAAEEFERLLANSNVISDGRFESAGSAMIGFALSRLAVDEAELLTIAVDGPVRGSKMGTGLLEDHIGNLRMAGVRKLFLEVAEDNHPGLGLYRKFGFFSVGKRSNYYQGENGQQVNAEIMALQL